MKTWKLAAIASLSLALPVLALAAPTQESLVDLVRAGNHEAVLAALKSGKIDVNATEPDGSTALMWATYDVDHELVSALLKSGAKANVSNHYGSTPLTEAVRIGDVDMSRMLLNAGANPDSPNQDNQTALMLAANIGSLEIAKMLIEHHANVNKVETFRGQTALMWAAGENHPDMVELLLAHGADVKPRAKSDDWPRQMTSEPRAQFRPTGGLTALLYATRAACYRCVVAIVNAGADINEPNPDGVTPLLNALDNRSFDSAMFLLDKGAKSDIWDMNGRTPIYIAVDMNTFFPRGFGSGSGAFAGFGDTTERHAPSTVKAMDVVNRLLDMGVDPNHELTRMRPNGNGRGRFADYMMRGGTGPLMIATLSYDDVAIKALLAHGAEVDLPNVFRMTPLMVAAGMSGSARGAAPPQAKDPQDRVISTIDLLLDAGADINARITDSHTHTAKMDAYIQGRDQEGRTALFGAVESGWDKVVKHLIDRGADSNIRDAAGKTALDAAIQPGITGAGGRQLPSAASREAIIAILTPLKK